MLGAVVRTNLTNHTSLPRAGRSANVSLVPAKVPQGSRVPQCREVRTLKIVFRGKPEESTLLKRDANLKRKKEKADIEGRAADKEGRANLFNFPNKKASAVSPVVPGQSETYPSKEPVANLAISSVEALKDDGNKDFLAGEFQKAIDKYDEAIKIDGMSHILFGNRSAAFASLKNYQAAFADAAQAVPPSIPFSTSISVLYDSFQSVIL